MGAFQTIYALSCELRIIKAKHIECEISGNLFVRCYFPQGKDRRVRLNSREIAPNQDPNWNESFSLECCGTENSIYRLEQEKVVFELRCRDKVPVLGRFGGSRLLGRGEILWKTILESQEMEVERWVAMDSRGRRLREGNKPPALQVGMKVRIPAEVAGAEKRRRARLMRWDECGCCRDSGRCSCSVYEILEVGAALEAF